MTVLHGDCLDVMPALNAESVDAIITDPPYGLKFMGKSWDHGVPGSPFWEAALRVAKPGAYLLAFGGTRTFHRLTCAIEDAGFEIHDTLCWLYGSGFPKHRSKLKPGWEPVVLARRQARKASPLNIDACRGVPGEGAVRTEPSSTKRYSEGGNDGFAALPGVRGGDARGRWPANVVLDDEAARLLDEQSGELSVVGGEKRTQGSGGLYQMGSAGAPGVVYQDRGGASRFFYTAKASRSERDAGLDEFPAGEAHTLSGGPMIADGRTAVKGKANGRNVHPTVKPLDLMQWLCRLVTPKGGLILDPFCGSGTTGRAAVAEGFRFVGIEKEAEYVEIARARIAEYAPLFDQGRAI